MLGRALDAVRYTGLARALEGALVDSGWLARLQLRGAEGTAAIANILKAVRLVRDFEEGGAAGPSSVAGRLTALFDAGSKDKPGVLNASGGNAVRIMTIHASKGLEFPLVAVAELPTGDVRRGALALESRAGRTCVALIPGAATMPAGSALAKAAAKVPVRGADGPLTWDDALAASDPACFYGALGDIEAAEEAAEGQRLFYVAATRAKEAVAVFLTVRAKKDDPTCKGVADDIRSAFFGQEAFPLDARQLDYGGSQPALYRCVRVSDEVVADADDAGDSLDVEAGVPCSSGSAGAAEGSATRRFAAQDPSDPSCAALLQSDDDLDGVQTVAPSSHASTAGNSAMVAVPSDGSSAHLSGTESAAVTARPHVIFLAPGGRRFDDALACELAREERLLFVCGHYEGIDERAYALADTVISLGDYVLTSGELASHGGDRRGRAQAAGVLGAPDGAEDRELRRRAARIPPVHAPRRLRGDGGAADPALRQPRCHRQVEARAEPRAHGAPEARSPRCRAAYGRRPRISEFFIVGYGRRCLKRYHESLRSLGALRVRQDAASEGEGPSAEGAPTAFRTVAEGFDGFAPPREGTHRLWTPASTPNDPDPGF